MTGIRIRPIFLCFILFASFAQATGESPQAFTLDGRLYSDSNGTNPLLDSNVTLKIQILDQTESCVLYEESQTNINTNSSDGYFTIQVGSATGSGKRTAGDAGHSMAAVYANSAGSLSGMKVSDGTACTATLAAGDQRFLRLTVIPSSGGSNTLSPNIPLDSVPNALVAESLQGFSPDQFIKVNETGSEVLNQTHLENIFSTTNYPILTALLSGSSPLYSKMSSNGTASLPNLSSPSSPAAGEVWYDGGSIKYYDGSTTQTLGTSSGGVTAVTAGTGLNVGAGPGGTIGGGTSGTLNVNVGTGANQIVQLNASSKLPAIDGSLLTNLPAPASVSGNAITSGTIGGSTAISTSGNLQTSGSVTSSLLYLYDHSGAGPGYVGLKTVNDIAAAGSSYILAFPDNKGLSGQVLSTDGAGNLLWSTGTTPSGSASGDLSGTYPGPTVSKIQGIAVSSTTPGAAGQVLRYDGTSQYIPTQLTYTDLVNSHSLSPWPSTSCSAGQAITWSSVSDAFACTTIALSASNFSSQTQNTFLAAPDGSSGTPTFRSIASADLPSGTLSGAGTAGYIPYYSTSTTLANSSIFQSSGNIGIGTNSPSYTLDVKRSMGGGGDMVRVQNTANDGGSTILYSDDAGTIQAITGYGNAGLGAPYGSTFFFATNTKPMTFFTDETGIGDGHARMTIKPSTGYVGIGTTSPAVTLDVNGTFNTSANITATTGVSSPHASNIIFNPSSAPSAGAVVRGLWGSLTSTSTTDMTNSDLRANQGSIVLTPATATTIGTTTGIYSLTSLSGAASVTSATGVYSSVGTSSTGTVANAYGLSTNVTKSGAAITNAYGLFVGGIQGTNHWAVYASDTSPSYFGGNVGIGTNAPSTALEVNGTVKATNFVGTMTSSSTTNTGGYTVNTDTDSSGSDGGLSFQVRGSPKLVITDSGNVGIGTTTPLWALTNSSGPNFTDSVPLGLGGTNSFVWEHPATSSATGYAAAIVNSYDGSGNSGLLLKTANTSSGTKILTANSGGVDRFVVRADGNVGIGTTNPGNLLTVAGAAAGYTYVEANNSAAVAAGTGEGFVLREGSSDGSVLRRERDGTGTLNLINIGGPLNFNTGTSFAAATPKMTILNNGNVGISTASPANTFQVHGSVLVDAYSGSGGLSVSRSSATDGSAPMLNIVPDSSKNLLRSYGEMTFWTAPISGTLAERMRIDTAGNVGIGTTAPEAKTEIYGSGQVAVPLDDSGSRDAILAINANGAGTYNGGAITFGNIQSNTANSLGFAGIKGLLTNGTGNTIGHLSFQTRGATSDTALTERMRITNTGYVGIGTGSPAAMLDVNGTLKAASIVSAPTSAERFYPSITAIDSGTTATGAFIIHTPIVRATNTMFRIRVHGYGYGVASVIDSTIVGYTYGSANANVDGNPGGVIYTSLIDNGNDALAKAVGLDANGKVAVSLGSTALSAYRYRLYVDAWIGSNTDFSTGWSIDRSTTAGFAWLDYTSLSAALVKTSSGNVGIGTTSPNTALEVTGASANIRISGTGTTAAGLQLNPSSLGGYVGTISNFPLNLMTNNSTNMTILTNGNVGIGTTAPMANTEIYGTGQVTAALADGGATGGTLALNTSGSVAGNGGAILFGNNQSKTAGSVGMAAIKGFLQDGSNNTTGDIAFSTRNNTADTALTERMRIRYNGNVGIGTTSAAAKLEVAGGAKIGSTSTNPNYTDHLVVLSSSSLAWDGGQIFANLDNATSTGVKMSSAFSSGNAALRIGLVSLSSPTTYNKDFLYLAGSSGYVGIGQINPSYKLDVTGDISASGCLRSSAGVASGTCVSDARLKTDIQPFNLGLNAILGITPHYFKYNGLGGHPASDKPELGVIAQEVEKTAPQLIVTDKVKLHPEDPQNTEIKKVNYTAFTYVLINAIKDLYHSWFDDSQSLHREIASIKSANLVKDQQIQKLEQENAEMKARLDRIEALLKK